MKRAAVGSSFPLVVALLLPAFLLPALLVAPAAAQSTTFTYQGFLEDGGAPANGLFDLRFQLFDVVSGGAPIGSVLCTDNVNVVNGVFTAQLDFGQQYATSAPRHLEIEVRRDTGLTCADAGGFALLSPRQPITATPMASHANASFALDAADGSPTGAVYVDNSGLVGIGTTSPASRLHVNGSEEGIQIQGPATGSPCLAYVTFSDASGTKLGYVGDGSSGDTNVFLSSYVSDVSLVTPAGRVLNVKQSGNVGIGTTTPAAKLDVRGDIRLGSGGEFRAAAGDENLRLVRGTINSTGSILRGSGFTASRVLQGVYRINYNTPFSATPSVTLTAEKLSGQTPRFPTAATESTTGFNVYIYTDASSVVDADFSFCVMGPR